MEKLPFDEIGIGNKMHKNCIIIHFLCIFRMNWTIFYPELNTTLIRPKHEDGMEAGNMYNYSFL